LGGYDVDDYGGSIPRLVKTTGGSTWSPNFRDVTEALVREAHVVGVKIVPWTVNVEADMLRLIEWGVDGIITDYPDTLRALMAKRGMQLPPSYARRQ
jgi:glycerophosphoryl diester phosphodiesterase